MSFQLSGFLDQINLADLARLLNNASRTGRLGMENAETTSSIYFERGNLVDVHANSLNGLPALKFVGTITRGKFEFFDSLSAPSRALARYPTIELIRILETKILEARQIQELLPAPSDRIKYLGGQIPTGFEVTEQELSICVKTSTGRFTPAELARLLQVDLWLVTYTLARFRALGVIEIQPQSRTEQPLPSPRAPVVGSVVLPPPLVLREKSAAKPSSLRTAPSSSFSPPSVEPVTAPAGQPDALGGEPPAPLESSTPDSSPAPDATPFAGRRFFSS